MRIASLNDFDVRGSRALLRVDVNSPIDRETGQIGDDNRLNESLPTIRDLANAGVKPAIIALQEDTLDCHNPVPPAEHGVRLAEKLGREVGFLDEVACPAVIVDIGSAPIRSYREVIAGAATIFVNGPAGVYESEPSSQGTRELWAAVADAGGYSVIGGGDTVASARRFIDVENIGFVGTGGGALNRYLSGQPLPLLAAMEKAAKRDGIR